MKLGLDGLGLENLERENSERDMKTKLALAAAVALLATACASTPEEQPVPVAAPAPVTQGPVVEAEPARPAPALPPVVAAPSEPLPTPGSIEDFVAQAGQDRVFFGYDQHTLSPEARTVLEQQALWLNTYPNVEVVLEGHADERGTREYNLALGARRAEAVKSFLVTQGVAPARLTTVSYGKERPIDGRSNAEGWARNRNAFTNITRGAVS